VLRHALTLAEQYDLPATVLRARYNLAAIALEHDAFGEAIDEVERGLILARERGDRSHERRLLAQMIIPLYVLGRWDDAAATGTTLIAGALDVDSVFAASVMASIAVARGEEEMMSRCQAIAEQLRESSYIDQRVSAELVFARDAIERGAPGKALEVAKRAAEQGGQSGESVEEAYGLSVEAAIELGDEHAIADLIALVAALPPAGAKPLLRAGRARLEAEQAHRRGDQEGAVRSEEEAIRLLRSLEARPHLALTLLERARRRPDQEAVAQAREICRELGATRWLERIDERSELVA
jgi:hypothetical protein